MKPSGKTDLKVNRRTLPAWHPTEALVLVYPFKIAGREHLMPFYEQFMTYIPKDIKVILLVKDISCQADILTKHAAMVIENEIEIIEFPRIFDIWIRDYAPLIGERKGYHFPVKFNYNPSYVEEKYSKYIQDDNGIGEELGDRFINGGMISHYFNWDMGNLTHNGAGTAIISNRFIADNETCDIDHELNSMLHISLGFSNIIFIPTEPEDATGHVDGMCRFISEKVLVVGGYPTGVTGHNMMNSLAKTLQEDLGEDYTIIRLENAEPEDHVEEGVGSAVGNHLNFLHIGDLILFPYYGDEISKQPLDNFKGTLKEHKLKIKVIPVDIPDLLGLAKSGGVLNCISWQVFSKA